MERLKIKLNRKCKQKIIQLCQGESNYSSPLSCDRKIATRKISTRMIATRIIATRKIATQDNCHPENCHPGKLPPMKKLKNKLKN